MKFSTALRNGLVGDSTAGTGNGFSNLMKNFVIDLYPGVQPATPDNAPGGSVLMTYSLNGNGATGATWAAPSAGKVSRTVSEVIIGVGATGGVASWGRIRKLTDLGTTNTTDFRVDVSVGSVAGTAELIVGNTTIASGDQDILGVVSMSIGMNT
jgi:hypothetical protein